MKKGDIVIYTGSHEESHGERGVIHRMEWNHHVGEYLLQVKWFPLMGESGLPRMTWVKESSITVVK